MENKITTKNNQREDNEFVIYYCAINEPIAEIVILEYFTKFALVEKVNNLFVDDFSINYKIEIPVALTDIQCLLCFMFMNKHITPPATFGVVLSDAFRVYNPIGAEIDINKIFEISFENYKKRNPNATNEELNSFRDKGNRRIDSYIKYSDDVHNVIEILKSRISPDKNKVIEEYSKIYPLRVIEEDKYYVSLVSEKKIKQYVGDNCPKFLYYYMFENQKKFEKEYGKVLVNLMEQGLIKSRWKNEFSLYMLIKSFFPSAIYQYHTEWLEKQSLDIYIPEYKIGVEYQGIQHYEEIDVFNGECGLLQTQKRDKIKREKCELNGVILIEWMYTDKIEAEKLINILKKLNIQIPQKQDITTFYKDNINSTNKGNNPTSKRQLLKICQYDLEGNYLNSYENLDIAASNTGISKESIRRVCSGIRNTGGGYVWRRYLKEEIPQNIRAYSKEEHMSGTRKIIQYSISGEIIASFNSISEAVRKTGINSKSIRETARGKQNHAGGYVWKYEDCT